MPDQLKPLTVASGHTENALPALGTRDELEDYWQEFQSKVQTKLEKWDKARASSEEEARHVWLK